MEIHIQLAGVELGPYSEKQVRDYLAEGLLSMGDPAKLEGSPSWGTVTEILEKIAEQTIAVEPEGEADRVENVELSTSPEPEVEPKAEFVEEPGSASVVTPPEEPDMVEASALNLKGRNQHETVRIPMPQVIGSFARKGPPNIKVAPVLSVPEPDASTAPTSSISWKQAPIATTALFPSNFRVPAKKSDADSDTAPPSLPEPPPLAHQSPSTSSQPTDPVVQSDAVVRIIPKTTDTEIRRAPPPIPTVWPEPALAEAASTASDQSPLPISAPADVVRVLSKKTDGKARALPPSVPAVGPEPTSTEGASATVARMPEPTVSPPTAVRIIPRNAEQESKSAVPLPSGKLPGMSSESLPSVVRALAKKTESPTNPPPAEAVKSEMTISKTLPTMARALANKSERTAKKSQPGHVPPLRASPEPISLPSVAEKAQEKTPSPDTSWAPATVIALPSKSSVVTPTSAPKGSGPPALPVAPPVQKDAGTAAPKSPLQSILLRKHALRNLIGLVLIVAGLAAFVILYVVFAYFSSSALQKALDDGNRDELAATVDFQAVRQSLKTQLEAQLGKPQVQDANFSAPPDSASFAVLSMIENSIDRYVTAEGISAFVKKTDQPTGPDQPQTMTPEVASSIFVELTSHPVVFEGLVSFNDFVIDRDVAKLHLQLYPSGWKLDRIELKSGLQFSSLSSPPAESIPSSPPASPPPEPAPAPGPESTPLPGPGAPAPPAPPTPSNANPAGSLTAPVVETYLDQGNAKLKQQDWDGAIADFNQVLVIDSKTTVAYFNRAMAKMGKGDADGAIADFSQAIELDPKLADAYLARGQAKLVQKDLDGAIADYTQAIIINPKLADAYMSRGDARTGKGDFDGAIADYTQLIQIDPNRANAYSNRGWARQAKNDLDGAILDFTQAISIDPKMAVAYYNRGLAHQAQGNLDAAILDFNQTLDLDPKRAGAYYNRGNAKNTKRDFEGAIADYNQAVALDPTIALAFCNRGLAKQARGDMDGALADYTQALTLDNTIAVAYYNRGLIKEQKSDLDGAIADSSHALDLEPKMAQAYYNRGFAKLAKGNLDGASIDLRKFCELVPRDHYSDHARLYLWLISKAEDPKANADDDLAHSLQEDWNSAPDDMVSKLAAFLLNRLSEDDLIAAAASDDVKKDQGQHCEVWYFVGMKRLLAEDRKVAYDDFQKCVATGEKDYCEYILAAAELQALDPSTKN